MFIGKYYYKLENQGRISLPKSFRSLAKEWVVSRGLDGCLFLFSKQQFAKEIGSLASSTLTKKHNRDLTRLMTNEALELIADKLGRVNLPDYLISFAKLSKNVVLVGSFNKIEIWDQDRYHQYVAQIENQAEVIAESIDVN